MLDARICLNTDVLGSAAALKAGDGLITPSILILLIIIIIMCFTPRAVSRELLALNIV